MNPRALNPRRRDGTIELCSLFTHADHTRNSRLPFKPPCDAVNLVSADDEHKRLPGPPEPETQCRPSTVHVRKWLVAGCWTPGNDGNR
jgi:hypothetical protein